MKVYHFDSETGAYLGSSEAAVDPLEHEAHVRGIHAEGLKKAREANRPYDFANTFIAPVHFLLPANATFIAPPIASPGYEEVFADGKWGVREIAKPEQAAETSVDPWLALRDKRNRLLANSDWTQMTDSPLGSKMRAEWANYRTALRDLTRFLKTPDDAKWPKSPGEA